MPLSHTHTHTRKHAHTPPPSVGSLASWDPFHTPFSTHEELKKEDLKIFCFFVFLFFCFFCFFVYLCRRWLGGHVDTTGGGYMRGEFFLS